MSPNYVSPLHSCSCVTLCYIPCIVVSTRAVMHENQTCTSLLTISFSVNVIIIITVVIVLVVAPSFCQILPVVGHFVSLVAVHVHFLVIVILNVSLFAS